jgi:hypothetical protein
VNKFNNVDTRSRSPERISATAPPASAWFRPPSSSCRKRTGESPKGRYDIQNNDTQHNYKNAMQPNDGVVMVNVANKPFMLSVMFFQGPVIIKKFAVTISYEL